MIGLLLSVPGVLIEPLLYLAESYTQANAMPRTAHRLLQFPLNMPPKRMGSQRSSHVQDLPLGRTLNRRLIKR